MGAGVGVLEVAKYASSIKPSPVNIPSAVGIFLGSLSVGGVAGAAIGLPLSMTLNNYMTCLEKQLEVLKSMKVSDIGNILEKPYL